MSHLTLCQRACDAWNGPRQDSNTPPRRDIVLSPSSSCADRDETGSDQKKLTNPTPEGFRGLFIDVCGMFVGGLWHDSSRL